MAKYTRIPSTTFDNLQLNAGIMLNGDITEAFNPATGKFKVSAMIGATDGGVTFNATPTYTDFGDGIDNCPANMKELKHLDSWEVTLEGTGKTISPELVALYLGAGDVDSSDSTKVTARVDLNQDTDFHTIWWVGDKGADGGFVAIKLTNALSTGGFQLQSQDKDKGSFSFTFTGHVSIDAQDVVPFEVYIKDSTEGDVADNG